MKLYLIRHGRTLANEKHLYCGSTDEPLSERGISEAESIQHALHPRLVYVSPMLRARQTAAILFPEAEQQIVEELREMDFGSFEGRSAEEMGEDAEYQKWIASECLLPCPGGEDMQGFSKRISRALHALVQQAIAKKEEELVIVAHGGSIMAAMSSYAQPAQEYFQWGSPNCGGYKAHIREESWGESPVLEQWEILELRREAKEA